MNSQHESFLTAAAAKRLTQETESASLLEVTVFTITQIITVHLLHMKHTRSDTCRQAGSISELQLSSKVNRTIV